MRRLAFLLVTALFASACSVPNITQADDDALVENTRIKVSGIKFDRPEGWRTLDKKWLKKTAASKVKAHDVAMSLGLTDKQFRKVKKTIDLYVVDEERNTLGAFDLVTVVDLGEKDPPAAMVDARTARHVDTAVGDVVTATFTLGSRKRVVEAQTLVVDADGTLVITVAAATRETVTSLADGILATLAED